MCVLRCFFFYIGVPPSKFKEYIVNKQTAINKMASGEKPDRFCNGKSCISAVCYIKCNRKTDNSVWK